MVSPTVLAADLSALTNTQGVTPDGIVGLDVLRGRCFTIDYSAQRVLFRPHARWDASLRFDRQSPYLVVNTLVDSIPFRVIVDTGAEGMLLFERAIPRTWVPRPGWAGRMGIEHCFHTDANYLRRMGVEFIGEVSFDQAIQWMTRGIFNPVLYGPLFRHLGMVTCRTFETPAAGTIPIFDLNREYVIEIYGERAAELLLPADNGR